MAHRFLAAKTFDHSVDGQWMEISKTNVSGRLSPTLLMDDRWCLKFIPIIYKVLDFSRILVKAAALQTLANSSQVLCTCEKNWVTNQISVDDPDRDLYTAAQPISMWHV